MYRFLLKPKWIAFHLVCALAIVGMVWLSFWQLRRLHQHDQFVAEVRRRTELVITPLEQLAEGGTLSPTATEWRRVSVSGTWLTEPTFEVVNVSQSGQSGHDAVAGLQLADGSVLVVNRGFAAGTTALPTLPSGTVRLTGRLRTSQSAGALQGTDNGAQRLTQIRRVDLAALSPQFAGRTVQSVYLDQLSSDPSEPSLTPVVFPDLNGGPPHLSYAVQWIIFSLSVLAGWALAVRKSVHSRSGRGRSRRKALIPEQYL
jgi:cytochrome oxidase assembly protein ShyY1